MKQKANKILLFLFVVSCFCSVFFLSASAVNEVKSGDFVFTVDGTSATLKEYKGKATDVEIPSKVGSAKVTAIGNEAFWANRTMKSVTIPTTVKVIGTAAFNECTALTKINIPYSVTMMGDAVFWYCSNLKQVFIPKNTTVIGDNVFVGCHSDLTVYVVKDSYAEKRIGSLKDVNMAYRYVSELKLSGSTAKLTPGGTVTLTYTVSPEKVYNSSVTYTSDNTAVATVNSKGKVTAVGAGTATITATAKDGSKVSATYKITVIPEKVTKVSVENATLDGYTLTWEKTKGATGYRVYKYNSTAKKYESYKSVSGNSLKLTDLKVGSYDYYRVYAYAKVGTSVYYAEVSPTCKAYTAKLGKVTSVTATNATPDSYTLTWEMVKDATGYKVYRYNSTTKKYELYKNISGNSLKITGLKPGSCDYYKVYAYAKVGDAVCNAEGSPTCKAYAAKLGKVTAVTAKPAHNYINLSWSAVDFATGYKLYFYNPETSKYTSIGATTKTSYKVSGLNPDTSYTFMVRAYMKSGDTTFNASYSPLTEAYTRPDYVSGLSVRENSLYTSKVTLEWDLLQGAAGYTVSVDKGTGSYETVAEIKDPTVNYCTVEGLQPGTEYLFKIKAYSVKSGSTIYGYISKTPLSVITNDRPSDEKEGFEGFIEAYSEAASGEESLVIISLYGTSGFEGENSELYEGVITSTEMSGTVYSYISEGKDRNGLTVGEILHCGQLGLSFSDAEVTAFDEDGNGYSIGFTLSGDKAGELFSFGEWEKVAEENEGFILAEESYGTAEVTAKVQNGTLDNVTVTVPLTVSFTLDGQQYSFTQVYTATYLFIR